MDQDKLHIAIKKTENLSPCRSDELLKYSNKVAYLCPIAPLSFYSILSPLFYLENILLFLLQLQQIQKFPVYQDNIPIVDSSRLHNSGVADPDPSALIGSKPRYFNKIVVQNMLRTYEVKQVFAIKNRIRRLCRCNQMPLTNRNT